VVANLIPGRQGVGGVGRCQVIGPTGVSAVSAALYRADTRHRHLADRKEPDVSRRGGRGRRLARRHRQGQRDRALDRWLRWRQQVDEGAQDRQDAALRQELERLGQRPGWRVDG
jgi:hypothetical protein